MTSYITSMLSSATATSGNNQTDEQYGRFLDEANTFKKIQIDQIAEKNGVKKQVRVQMEIPDDTEKLVKVIVPQHVKPGEEFKVDVGEGRIVKTMAPSGKGPGSVLWIPVPKNRNALSQVSDWFNKNLGL